MSNQVAWRGPFFRLYLGQAFSLISSSAVQFAIIWWITAKTGSALALAAASIAGLLPQVLLGPFAGVVIDRYSRKAVMLLADTGVAISSLVLALAFLFGQPPFILVLIILFMRALGEAFHKPALLASIPTLVPESALQSAGGFGQLISSLCSMLCPMIGALLVSLLKPGFILLVDVAGAALAVFALSGITLPAHKGQGNTGKGYVRELKDGIKAFIGDRALLYLSLPLLLTSVTFMPLGSLLPLMVKLRFGGGAWAAGIVQTLFFLGMLASALAFGITGGTRRPFFAVCLSAFLLGVCAAVAGFLPPSAFWLFCVFTFVMGITGAMGNVPYMAYLQSHVPSENLGKVISLVTSLVSLCVPLGIALAGPLAEFLGMALWMRLIGFSLILISLLIYVLAKSKFVETIAKDNH